MGRWLKLWLIFLFSLMPLYGESFDFVNKDISEILYAVSLYKEILVSQDDTVHGKGEFHVTGDDFDRAFDAFLSRTRLYVKKTEKEWTVSKYRIQRNEDGLYCLDCYDMTPQQLFEKTAIETGICITYDSLPSINVSLHTGWCKKEEIVKRICGLCNGYEIEKKEQGVFHVGRVLRGKSEVPVTGQIIFTFENGGWRTDIQNALLGNVIEKFCSLGTKEFCIVSGGEGKITRAYFSGKSFEETICLLCSQAGAECILNDGIFYVFHSKNERKIVDDTCSVWKKVQLKHIKSDDFCSAVSKRFTGTEIVIPNKNGLVLIKINLSEEKEFDDFLKITDVKSELHLVELKYLKTADFFAYMPPFLDKSKVFDSGQGDSFYFTGTEEEYKRLLDELPCFDKPVRRISYDLLIIQYQDSKGRQWDPSLKITKAEEDDENSVSAVLGSVLDFNMDVVGAFGLKFAAGLQTSINKTRARVFADTTLNGVSGRSISFQNTNTYRYRDNNLDPETGKPVYSGVTREIISGLKLEITGNVTGDGMVTTKITASVSRQGADTSSKTGNPPPSSEKIVCTEVRGKSGEPVVLSGLVQEEEIESSAGIPLISQIPLIGKFFGGHSKEKEKTELVIYLVPESEKRSCVESEEKTDEKAEMKRLIKEFCIDEN